MWKVLVLSSIGVGSVLLLAKHLLTPTETVREDANEESCISNNEETTRASERRARSRKKTLFYLKRRRPTRINISAKKAPLRAPKAGVTFGFGGKLVSFHSSSGHSEVNVRDLVTELNLVSTSSEFEVAIKSGDRSSLRLLCDQKYQQSGSEDDRETWGFLKVMFEDEGTARTKLLNHLGFSLPAGEVNESIEGSCPTCLPTDSSFDDGVQRALVVGDYKGAVAQCIAANKMADALVIAQVGGTSLWESTRDQYLRKNSSPYLKVVAAMVNNDLVSLVKTRPLKSWKETLALLCTFAQGDDWTLLCDALASRLRASGNTLAATLCYICSGNIDRTVEIWSKNVTTEHEGKTYVELFQDLMEKTVILALATGQKRFSASLCKLVEKYVEILASQGLLTTAMEYLRLMGSDNLSPELVILRDRIALSSEPEEEASGSINSGNSRLPEAPSYGVNQTYSGAGPSGNYYQVKLFPKKVSIVMLCFVLGMLAILAGFFLFLDGQSSYHGPPPT